MKTLTNEKSGRFFLYLLYLFSMPLFAQPQYQFIDLDALINNDSEYTKTGSVATVVNDLNHVAGWYLLDMPDQDRKKAIGFIYRPDSGVEEIVAPYDRSVKILDMNNNDQFIGKWISPFGDKSYFTHWQDFKNVDMLESVTKISDSGNVLGIINKTRGVLKSSVAILQRDNTVIDILQDAVDCDRLVMGDCDGDNRIDFDYWQKIAALDMNNQGQIVFSLMRNTEPDSYTPRHEYKIYSYTQDMGIRFLKSEFFRRPARYPHGFFGQLQAILRAVTDADKS